MIFCILSGGLCEIKCEAKYIFFNISFKPIIYVHQKCAVTTAKGWLRCQQSVLGCILLKNSFLPSRKDIFNDIDVYVIEGAIS